MKVISTIGRLRLFPVDGVDGADGEDMAVGERVRGVRIDAGAEKTSTGDYQFGLMHRTDRDDRHVSVSVILQHPSQ